MEPAQSSVETAYYSNVEETRTAKPAGYPLDSYTDPNNYVSKLNGNGNKVGPGIVLKVMSGDKVNIRASNWYYLNGADPGTPVNPLNDLLNDCKRRYYDNQIGRFFCTDALADKYPF